MLLTVGLSVPPIQSTLDVHRVCNGDRLAADDRGVSSRQDRPAEWRRYTGRAQCILDADGVCVTSEQRRPRRMRPTVDLLVTGLQLVRVVRLHRHVLSTHGALEALPVEDDLVDGSDLLHLVDALPAPLTLRLVASGEHLREAVRQHGKRCHCCSPTHYTEFPLSHHVLIVTGRW